MTIWELLEGLAGAAQFALAMAAIAACGYFSALAVWDGGLWLFGESQWVKVIIGPLAAFAGIAGTIAIPGGIAIFVNWILRIFMKKRPN